MGRNQHGFLLILVVAWISSLTMLQPLPTTTIAVLSAQVGEVPHWPIWARWILAALFVLGGTVSAFLAFRGSQRAFKCALAFSVLYVAYWLSEYLLAHSAMFIFSLVLRQLRENELVSKLVIAQHQFILPTIHLVFLTTAAFKLAKRGHAI